MRELKDCIIEADKQEAAIFYTGSGKTDVFFRFVANFSNLAQLAACSSKLDVQQMMK